MRKAIETTILGNATKEKQCKGIILVFDLSGGSQKKKTGDDFLGFWGGGVGNHASSRKKKGTIHYVMHAASVRENWANQKPGGKGKGGRSKIGGGKWTLESPKGRKSTT